MQVTHLGAVIGGLVELQILYLCIGERQFETIAEFHQILLLEFLLLVRGHLALTSGTHTKTFFGLRKNHRRCAAVIGCCMIGRINLAQIMTAAFESIDFFVSERGTDGLQARTLTKEMFAIERAIIRSKSLQLSVHRAIECINQFTVGITRKERIPIRAPQEFDHIPASATKQGFQFIDDVTIAAHRSIETLQVTVDNEDEVIEFFARGQRERGERFGFIHLAITEHAPHFARLWCQ